MTAAQPPDDSALGRPPHPPSPVRNPIRQMFMVNDVQNRWPFALRAAACMAVPALIGWLAGDLASGLMATIGAFTSLYGSGRPYLNRGVHLGVVAVCFALAVALGNWAAEVPWAGVLTVSVIAMAAVLVCNRARQSGLCLGRRRRRGAPVRGGVADADQGGHPARGR